MNAARWLWSWSRVAAWLTCCALALVHADVALFYGAIAVAVGLLLMPARDCGRRRGKMSS